jgi:nucleoside phosphorylase/tetratricopeptide (TPR) repeat protein
MVMLLPVAEKEAADRDRAEALARRVTVGVVTALPEERAAMLAMLDRPVPWASAGRGAGRVYDLGEIEAQNGGRHVVALALAGMGNNSAASRGAMLLREFPEIEAILMVGIAGGVPNPERVREHVRLGDVVVSDRLGVIQYDFIKRTARIKEARFSPRPPHARLLEAAKLLESDAFAGARPWEDHVKRAASLQGAARPEASADVLLASKAPFQRLTHPDDPQRVEGQPRVFFGPIASGNVLLKDPGWRDRLRDHYGVKAVEMEGSGIADATWDAGVGYLVVRGICDYCDRNKNDAWHMYAAVVAAAYARALLERMATQPEPEEQEPSGGKKGDAGTGLAPNNLRARNPYFRGREEELRRLEEGLKQDRQATIAQASVFGLGGVGKSALALELAHRALDRGDYPGGIWWVASEGDPVDALVRLAPTLRAGAPEEVKRRLPPGETKADAIAEEVRVALQAEKAPSLLVLDNVSVRWTSAHVPGGAVRVLATMRDAGLALGEALGLGVLPREQALAMADALAGEPGDMAEGEARERVVVTELGGLAVAVEMAARGTKRWFRGSWVAYEQALRKEMEKVLEDPKLVGDYGRGVFAALDLSIDACDAESRGLLEGAAVFAPEGVPIEWAMAAAGMDVEGFEARRALGVLGELGLVTEDAGKRTVSMHRLVHRRVRGRAEKEHEEAWSSAARRGVESVMTWMLGAIELRQQKANVELVDTRREHIEQALLAAEDVNHDHAWVVIANQLAAHLQNRAEYARSHLLLVQALTRAEQLAPHEPALLSMCLHNLALTQTDLGNSATARAYLERAMLLAEQEHGADHPIVATILSNLATAHRILGESALAIPLFERALRITEATYGPHHPTVAVRLANLARAHMGVRDVTAARPLLERALALAEERYGADHPTVAICLSDLAELHKATGEPVSALLLLERGLRIVEATYPSNHLTVVTLLSKLAAVHMDLGQTTEARPLVERALSAAETVHTPDHPTLAGLRSQLSIVLHDLAQTHGRQGGWETALDLARQSLALAERAGEPLLVAEGHRLLADAALHGTFYEDAKIHYEEAARRFDILDRPKDAATARLLLVPLLLTFAHDAQAAPHVAWLRANRARDELGPQDRADIEDVLRVADAPQEPQT